MNSNNPLTPLEAYYKVMLFAHENRLEPNTVLLAMHAAVPRTLNVDLLHLLRINFLTTSNHVSEADVLYSDLCRDLGNGYFEFDEQVRFVLLQDLIEHYATEDDFLGPRLPRIARFIINYADHIEQQITGQYDPTLRKYLAIQRWVALAFLDEDSAVYQLAKAVKQAVEEKKQVARLQIGGLASALSIPLMKHNSFLVYLQALDEISRGNQELGENLMRQLPDVPIVYGDIELERPRHYIKSTKGAASTVTGDIQPSDAPLTPEAETEATIPETPPRRIIGKQLDEQPFSEIVDILSPLFSHQDERIAILRESLSECSIILPRINYSGAAHEFTVKLVQTLVDFGSDCTPGQPMLLAVLEHVRRLVDLDTQARIDAILEQLEKPQPLEDVDTDVEAPTQSRRLAILIGVDQYTSASLSNLKTSRNDANALAQLLSDPEIGNFENAAVYTQEPSYSIREQITELFRDARRDDVVLLYFSGHGIRTPDGKLYLATGDTEPDHVLSTAIPADFVQQQMKVSLALRQIVILDCAYSGTFSDGVKSLTQPELAILTSTSAFQPTYEDNELSLFSHYLLEGLQTDDTDLDRDGSITIRDLFSYVYDRIRDRGYRQTPQLSARSGADDFVIAQAPRARRESVARAMVDLLTPFFYSEGERKKLVTSALFGSTVVNQINWSGPPHDFTTRLVDQLLWYGRFEGEHTLEMLLKEVKQMVGVEKQAEVDTLLARIPAFEVAERATPGRGLDRQTFNDLVDILIPNCVDLDNRRFLVETAFFNCSVRQLIDYSGSARTFVVKLVKTLDDYGECEQDKPALVSLLETMMEGVGYNQQLQIKTVIRKISSSIVDGPDVQLRSPSSLGHIFISYTRENLETVRRITTGLLNAGINVWLDTETLVPGTQNWEQAIRDAIEEAGAVLYMASPEAFRSNLVLDELALAEAAGKPIYGVWVDGAEWLDIVPVDMGNVQYFDVRGDAYATGLQQLIRELGGEPSISEDNSETSETPPEQPIRNIRIYISSPGDVSQERQIALAAIDRLQYDPMLRGKVSLEAVSWDKPGVVTPMLATMTPQEAINRSLPRPSECDIVVVIFWSRMGTPLGDYYRKSDGEQYLSGTEWEYQDAYEASQERGLPLLVVYRRLQTPEIRIDDPDFSSKSEQYQRVNKFFESFTNADGAIRQDYHRYQEPEDFRIAFEIHLEALVNRVLEIPSAPRRNNVSVVEEPPRLGSPYPGLRAFTEHDASIFFGRGGETDRLVKMVEENRFVTVIGASGSGKSSLVCAGLIPRLRSNAIEGSRDWYIARCTPSFFSLAVALMETIPVLESDPIEFARRSDKLAAFLQASSDNLDKTIENALKDEPEWSQVLLFIDQLEELLTLTPERERKPFIEMLTYPSGRIRVVATLRADFFSRMLPLAEEFLHGGSFALAQPSRTALHDMIVRPAERAGIAFEGGLVERIIDDISDDPGGLALMAYILDELYARSIHYNEKDDKVLTIAEYEQLGGAPDAIGRYAERIWQEIDLSNEIFDSVFAQLVGDTATRRRMPYQPSKMSVGANKLIESFVNARLFTMTTSTDGGAVVEIAHDALLHRWVRLANWIEARY